MVQRVPQLYIDPKPLSGELHNIYNFVTLQRSAGKLWKLNTDADQAQPPMVAYSYSRTMPPATPQKLLRIAQGT